MPLRFDQPSLLGEWKGDPAIIHQALSQMHSASEGEKNRANAKAIAEAKAVKKPSFKISSAKSPFSKDRDNISARINTMLDPTVDDNTKAHLDQQNLQDVAQAEAQKKALEALEKSVVDIEQRHGKNARTKVFRDAFSDIYTNSTVADRDEKLTKAAEILAKPEEYIDGDGVVMDYFNKLTPVTPTYKSSKESGQTTKEDETVSHTRFPLDGDPALDSNGQQLMNNGVPVYKKRIANNPRELLGYADNYLKNNDEYSGILHTQTAKKYKTDFEKEVNNWAGTFDTPPSEEEKQSFLQGLVANKTRNDIAEKFYKNDKAWIDANSKVSLDEPKQLQKQTKTDRDNVWDVSSMGAQGSDYNTRVGQKGEIGSFKTHGGVVIKNKNGKKPVLTLNEQTAKNESSGKYEKLVESTDATLDNVRAAYWYKDKAGNRIKDTQKDIIAHLKAMSPKQVVDGDYSAEPVAYLTANKASGTGDLALNPDELKEYNTLKSEFTKDYPSPSVTSPEEKGYDQNEIDRYDRLQELEASKVQKTKTFSVRYGQVEGQLGQLIGEKNASQEALMKSMGEKQYAEYLQGKKILEDKKKEYYNNLNKGSANKKTAEVERKTPDGKIAIFDSNTKQFLRYK